MKKIMIIILFSLLFAMATIVAFGSSSVSKYTGESYSHNSIYDNSIIANAIDVSQYQGTIDWESVKADGIDYAIIRVGGRGYAESGRLYFDDCYQDNLHNAKNAGIKVGIYYFSQARTESEAIEEANHCLKLLNNYEIDLPIFMDYEHASDSLNPGRIKDLSIDQRTANAEAFCRTIESSGYEAGFYSNLLFLRNSINGDRLSDSYNIWVAQFSNNCSYENDYSIWQYSSTGTVKGISGNVDCDFWYLKNIESLNAELSYLSVEYDGTEKKPKVNIPKLKEGRDFTVQYENNTNVGMASAIIKGCGMYIGEKELIFEIKERESGINALFSADTKIRINGDTRYETSMKTADSLKKSLGVDKFNTVIVAYGDDYADALSGSYLAKKNNAPILLIDSAHESALKNYIDENVEPGGTVYLLGGVGVVSQRFENSLSNFAVKRLGGIDRYETNLKILREAGLGDDKLLLCSAWSFADSLSASATGNPILLVGNSLSKEQTEILKASDIKKYYIIGGEGVVNHEIQKSLRKYGKVERVSGLTRYETSVAVANEFFDYGADAGVLVYGENFPDGLSAGPLALSISAPLILVSNYDTVYASEYFSNMGIKRVAALGGPTLISDNSIDFILS